jgi:serine/threonine protein kinase
MMAGSGKPIRTPLPGAEPGGVGATVSFGAFTCEEVHLISEDGASGLVYEGISRDYYETDGSAHARLIVKECYPLDVASSLIRDGDRLILLDTASIGDQFSYAKYGKRYKEAFINQTQLYLGSTREQTSVPVNVLEANGTLYLVCDASNGDTLDKTIAQMDILIQLHTLIRICEVISAMHDSGYVYLDLKPENILAIRNADKDATQRYTGEIKLFDFDTVARIDELQSPDMVISASGDWSAYEQTHEGYKDKVGPSSDLYSVGVLLFWLIMGRPPGVNEVIHFNGGWDIPTSAVVHPAFKSNDARALRLACHIFGKTLVIEPSDRYAQVQDLIADLTKLEEILMPTNKTHSDEHQEILAAVQTLSNLAAVQTLSNRNEMFETLGRKDDFGQIKQMLSQRLTGNMPGDSFMAGVDNKARGIVSDRYENTAEDITIAAQNVARLEKQMIEDPNDDNKALLLAMALTILCDAQKPEEADNTVARIKELADRHPKDEAIALQWAWGTMLLVRKASSLENFPLPANYLNVFESLVKSYPDNIMFYKLLTTSLTRLRFAQSDELASSAVRIEEIARRFPKDEYIAWSLAGVLKSLSSKQQPEEAAVSVARIEEIAQRFPEDEYIA